MDKNYMDLHLLTDRYVLGKLSQDEEAEFEERLIWDSDLSDELDLALQLRQGLQASVTDIANFDADEGFGMVKRLNAFFEVPLYSAAASFLFAVMLTTGIVLNLPGLGGDYPDVASTRTQFLAVPLTRADVVDPIVVDKNAWAVLVVELDYSKPYSLYRATVKRVGAEKDIVWMQADIQPTYLNTLALGMPGGVLDTGQYTVTVEGIDISAAGARSYEDLGDLYLDSVALE